VGAGTLLNNYAHIFDLLIRLRQVGASEPSKPFWPFNLFLPFRPFQPSWLGGLGLGRVAGAAGTKPPAHPSGFERF
jgi:hypothetical protein